MRELKVVGLDVEGKHIICEGCDENGVATDTFKLPADDRLRAAMRGDGARVGQGQMDMQMPSTLRPKDIQARVRSGASVEQVAAAAGVDVERVQRFAHPVLLERSRVAELATAAHPVLADGPAVLTLLETVNATLIARGLNPDSMSWDAWRNEDGRWTVQLAWKAGRSDNVAHFRFTPGAHGGTVLAVDDEANALIDPHFERPLRPVAPVAQLDFDEPEPTPAAEPAEERRSEPARARRGRKPPVPAWEDVLLGVRSGGQR
ncbi:septation protein SepH [Mycobacterium shimoidei]|uniref:DUF3071 domain-containing protein n=1 Tax=Mycobacterium shimoidei TaxID=29313 RepID=A0A1E3TE24_MYCSH|nr:septation protein SepH [Mycobacterium shimoidei]MCV7258442.1 DUF3071 domain-containing protein [Mycobacterium shimoidei]ODR12687.1 hypothetical protein BHQ16_14440 [Mycobacterium shimoidei]ORW81793.1 hypothetical protein AWC26_07040 [Mycobacterium shimoidei]SRX93786.1 hypothetical protein MSP7336_02029 [Mycobacterium shimoidei]